MKSRMSLLFVHTDSDDRAMYAEYLRSEGFAVEEKSTTDGALPIADGTDAVITGLMVPGALDPVEYIRRLRDQSPNLPIIVVTACVLDDRIEKAYGAGANVVLMKPCLPGTLSLAVQTTIEAGDVCLLPASPRRASKERRSQSRGGRRAGDEERNQASVSPGDPQSAPVPAPDSIPASTPAVRARR
jgi:DNA-binding response OmpR family regulator